jgi:hypothetical protein
MANGSASLEKYSAVFERVGRENKMIMWTSAYDDAKKSLEKYMDHVHPGAALIRKVPCKSAPSILSGNFEVKSINCCSNKEIRFFIILIHIFIYILGYLPDLTFPGPLRLHILEGKSCSCCDQTDVIDLNIYF